MPRPAEPAQPPTGPQQPQQPPAGGKPGCDCDGGCNCPCCPCKPKEEPKPGIAITQEHLDKIAGIIIKQMQDNPDAWRGPAGKDGKDGKDGGAGEFSFRVDFEGPGGTISRSVTINNGDALTIPPSRLEIIDGGQRFQIEEALGDPLQIEVIGDLSAGGKR